MNNATILAPNTFLRDGRYIFVVRVADKNIIVRRYDRNYVHRVGPIRSSDSFAIRYDYNNNRYPNNYHTKSNDESISQTPCQPGSTMCVYDHVRHTQLNGTILVSNTNGVVTWNAWDPVYCAGELRVLDGKIDRINNASGHFKPNAVCVDNTYTLLQALGAPLSDSIKKGSLDFVNTEELFTCSQDDTGVARLHGNFYTACAYLRMSNGHWYTSEISNTTDSVCTAAAGEGSVMWRWGVCEESSFGFPWWS